MNFKPVAQISLFVAGSLMLGTSGITLLPNSVQAQTARVVYVNAATGNDAESAGSETAPYRTISFALKQAEAGTTVRVASGTYSTETGERFPLELKSGVNLQGNDATKGQDVLVRGGGKYLSPTFAKQDTTIVAQKGSIVQGLTITNPNTRGTGIWVETGNPTIANNTFSNSLREGVFVSGSAAPRITNNVFTSNSASGVSIAREAQGEVSNNVFDNTGFGIQVSETSTPMIANNQVTRNQDGIVISHSARPTLRQNRVENNLRYGVVIVSDARPDLGSLSNPGNNTVKNNGQFDIYNLNQSLSIAAEANQLGKIETGKAAETAVEEPDSEPQQAVATAKAPKKAKAKKPTPAN